MAIAGEVDAIAGRASGDLHFGLQPVAGEKYQTFKLLHYALHFRRPSDLYAIVYIVILLAVRRFPLSPPLAPNFNPGSDKFPKRPPPAGFFRSSGLCFPRDD
ncbi:hypothetical protein [Henriciella marina]|uniref:hypothetical protein n=1 Tax=Henriciella marina TaxID=453851 RepID=UPI0022B210B0|nr:hypothetical protein [Henriciella marina]